MAEVLHSDTNTNMDLERSFLPSEWNDDDRMNFMFSAFPENRNLNPKHWDSKMQFWRNLLVKSCNVINEIYFDAETLKNRFNRNGVTPLGLNTVLRECVKTGTIMSVKDLKDAALNDTWVSWSLGVAKKSLSWTVGLVWSGDNSDPLPGDFVVLDVLQRKAERLLSEHYKTVEFDSTDHVVPWNVLRNRWKKIENKDDDKSLELAIFYLKTQRKVTLLHTAEGEKIVKFPEKSQRNSTDITEVDLGILCMKKTMASLQLQIMKLDKEMQSLQNKATACIKQGKKNSALRLLRKKKQIQKALDKRENSLETSQEILSRIQQAESDKMVLAAYKHGSMALKNAQEGMKVDDVDKIIDDVEESIQDLSDVSLALEEGNKRIADAAGNDIDADELEKELRMLMLEQKELGIGEVPATTGVAAAGDKGGAPHDKEGFDLSSLPAVPSQESAHRPQKAQRDFVALSS